MDDIKPHHGARAPVRRRGHIPACRP